MSLGVPNPTSAGGKKLAMAGSFPHATPLRPIMAEDDTQQTPTAVAMAPADPAPSPTPASSTTPAATLHASSSEHTLPSESTDPTGTRHWFTPASGGDSLARSESADLLPVAAARSTLKKGSGHGGGGLPSPRAATTPMRTRSISPVTRGPADEGGQPSESAPLSPTVITSAKSFRAPVLLPTDAGVAASATAAASSDGVTVPALATSTFAAIARHLPSPFALSLQDLRPEDLSSRATSEEAPTMRYKLPGGGGRPSSAAATRNEQLGFGSTSPRPTSAKNDPDTVPPLGRPQSAHPAASRATTGGTSDTPATAPARPMSARPQMAPTPGAFDPSAELASAFAAAALVSPPRSASGQATGPAGVVGLGTFIRRKADRATSAARRAWSITAKIIRPPGIPMHITGGASPAPAEMDDHRPSLFQTFDQDEAQVSAQFRPTIADTSALRPTSATPHRPSTARPSTGTPRQGASRPGSAAVSKPRPMHAVTRVSGRTARAYAPSSLGAPPPSIPNTSPLLAPSAHIYPGTPSEQIEAIYAREREVSERRFERQESARTTAPSFVPDVGLTLHTGREKEERPAASPGKKFVRDILTGETREVDITIDSAGMEIRDDEELSEDEPDVGVVGAGASSGSLAPLSPGAVVLVLGAGGFHHFRSDSAPVRVTPEDTFRDLELFKSRRLRTEQLEAEARREEAETNIGERPAWKTYDDYSVKSLAGGKLPDAMQPPIDAADLASVRSKSREANVHYGASFVPAHMLPFSALTGVDTGEPTVLVTSLTQHTVHAPTIGDHGAVRSLTALPRGAKKTFARVRAESAHDERRRALQFAKLTMDTMHRSPVTSTSAPTPPVEAGDASAEDLQQAAADQRRRIKGTHYHTAAWKAKILDNTSAQASGSATARPATPGGVGSPYAQRRLDRRPMSAAGGAMTDRAGSSSFHGRSVGSASSRTPLHGSSQSVHLRGELAARKSFQLASNRAIARAGFIDIEAYNEAARQAHAKAVELGLANGPPAASNLYPGTFGIRVEPMGRRPGSAPNPKKKKKQQQADYFHAKDVRQVHGEVREKKEMELTEAEAEAAAAAAALAAEHARLQAEAAAVALAAAAGVAASSSQDPSVDGPLTSLDGHFLPIAEEKTTDVLAVAEETAAQVFHHPRSTHSSRLRFLAAPRSAGLIGSAMYVPLRGFSAQTSPVRIANTHGARDPLVDASARAAFGAPTPLEESPGWAGAAMKAVGMDRLERYEMKQRRVSGEGSGARDRFVLVSEPGPSDLVTLSELATGGTPRVHHSAFPVRTRVTTASGDVTDFVHTAVKLTPSQYRPIGQSTGALGVLSATTAQPTSEVRALAQVPMTARHSFAPPARGNKRRPMAATARPVSASTTRGLDAQQRDREEYLARFHPTAAADAAGSLDPSSGRCPSVRALPVVDFHQLASSHASVFSRLVHHPDEARLLSGMWTPASLITRLAT